METKDKERKLLNSDEGMRIMHDNLVWSIITKRYHVEINQMWNDIGGWQS